MVKWSRSFPIYNTVTCGDRGHSCFLVLQDYLERHLLIVQLLQPMRFLLLVLWYHLSHQCSMFLGVQKETGFFISWNINYIIMAIKAWAYQLLHVYEYGYWEVTWQSGMKITGLIYEKNQNSDLVCPPVFSICWKTFSTEGRARPGPDEMAQGSNRFLQTNKAEWNLPSQILMQEAELQWGGEQGLCGFPSQALGHKRSHLHRCPAVSWGQLCSPKPPTGGTALLTCCDSLSEPFSMERS